MDFDSVTEFGIYITLAVLMGLLAVAFYVAVIFICGWAIEQLLDWLNIGIDRTIYWTGVALLVLFCAFGKTTVKRGDD